MISAIGKIGVRSPRAGGLAGLRVQRRQRLPGKVGEQVDPVRRDGVLAQHELRRLAHGATLL